MHRIDGPGATVDKKFTEGDPAGGVPATVVTASWANDMQEELMSVLGAGSITPVKGTQDQVLAAIRAIIAKSGHGQCRLSIVSSTSIKLSPYDGNNLIINGVPQQVPAAGITISNASLAASTVYYVYTFMNSGTMTLELSTIGHTTGTTGIEQKSGDATRSLVGMIRTNATIQFVNSQQQRFCLNWFNRQTIGGSSGFAANRSTTSSTMVEISASERLEFLAWGNEAVFMSSPVNASINTAGSVNTALYTDASSYATAFATVTAGQGVSITTQVPATFASDGYHFASVYGFAPAGFTATWSLSSTVLTVLTRG
jgi:hypothetical protein